MADLKMGFIEHMEELRRRIIVMFLALGVAVCVGYVYSWQILDFLKKPGARVGIPLDLHYQSVLEPFMVRFKIAMYAALVLTLPVIIYEVLAFVAPALKKREKRVMYYALLSIIVFFLLGMAFCYFYILPIGLKWLVGQAGNHVSPVLMAGPYIGLVALLLVGIGLSFETPLLVWLAVRLGIVTPRKLHKNWRWAVIVTLVFAAVITPDWNPVTMMLVAVPMFILYEASIFVASLGRKKAKTRKKTASEAKA